MLIIYRLIELIKLYKNHTNLKKCIAIMFKLKPELYQIPFPLRIASATKTITHYMFSSNYYCTRHIISHRSTNTFLDL